MSESTRSPVRSPRLNPFAFPSDTTLRFFLLVIFVVCGSGRLYGEFHIDVPTDQAAGECASRAWSEVSDLNMSTSADADRNAAIIERDVLPLVAHCAALFRPGLVWNIGGIFLTLAAAAAVYWLYPIWKLKTGHLERITSSELPEVEQELRDIAETAQLRVPARFVWNPLAAGLPVAFGCHGKYYLALSGSFIAQHFQGDKTTFRAIMLHELAHIRNGDVSKTYFTISLWLAFLITTLTPSILVSFWFLMSDRWFYAATTLLDSIFWTGVVMLSGLAVLRAREYYADIRASAWDQTSQIDRALATLPARIDEGWRGYFRFHPGAGERRRIVGDPSGLFRLSFADAFGVGIAAWSIVEVLSFMATPFWPQGKWASLVFFWSIKVGIPAVVFVFAVGVIGIGVWRGAFASILKGDPPSKGAGWLGAALVAGCLPGLIHILGGAVTQAQPIPFSQVLVTVQLNVVTYIVLLVACFLIFRWIADAASAWLEVVLQSRSPRLILVLTVAMALILVIGTFAVGWFFVTLSVVFKPWQWQEIIGIDWIYGYDIFMGGPVILASVAVWAFPDLWLRHLYGRSRHTCVGGGLGLSIGRPVEAKEGYTGGVGTLGVPRRLPA
jgi:Zn-dependent protease with chaperone function